MIKLKKKLQSMLAIGMSVFMTLGLVPAGELTAYAAEQTEAVKVTTPEVGKKYVIVEHDKDGKYYAMRGTVNDGYTNSTNYHYSGFDGVEVTVSDGKIQNQITENMIWETEAGSASGAMRLLQDGQKLRADYVSNSKGGNDGSLTKVTGTDETSQGVQWTYDSSARTLKNVKNGKYLTYDSHTDTSASAGLFTIRSSVNDGTLSFYEVTAGSGEPAVPEEPKPFAAASSLEDGEEYIVVASDADGKFALGNGAHAGYENTGNYKYSGLTGTLVTVSGSQITGDVSENLVWVVAKNGSAITLTNKKTGKKLDAAYSSTNKTGNVSLGSAGMAWSYSSKKLAATSAENKQLTYDGPSDHVSADPILSGEAGFFTVRSRGDDITFYKVNGGTLVKDHEHSYTTVVETKEATCTTLGSITRKCACGEVSVEPLPADPKNHGDNPTEVRNQKPATETEEGYTGDTYCTACNTLIKAGTKIEKLPPSHTHSYTTETVTKKATCKDKGILTKTCSCGESITEEIPVDANAHSYGAYVETTPGTCKVKAVLTATCELCGSKTTKEGELNPSNHAGFETEVKNAAAATEEAEGYTGDTYCKGCNAKIADGKAIPKLLGKFAAVSAAEIENNEEYVIVSSDKEGEFALGNKANAGYKNDSGYQYSGLTGSKVTVADGKITSDVYESMIWVVTKNGSNITLKNKAENKLLKASYANNTGTLVLGSEGTTWSFNSEKKLVASSADGGKQLTYDSPSDHSSSGAGNVGLFTVRTSGDVITFYKVNGGTVKADSVVTDPVKAEYAGGPFTAVDQPVAGKKYVVVVDGHGLTTRENSGFINGNEYTYTGFDGEAVTISSNKIEKVKQDMVWEVEKDADGTLYLKNVESGKYLTSAYSLNAPKGGSISIGSKGNSAQWKYDSLSKELTAPNSSNKVLSYDTTTSTALFTIRSSGNANASVTFFTEGTPSKDEMEEEEGGEDADPDATYVAFSSDVHNGGNSKSDADLNTWINAVSGKVGNVVFDTMGFCGDIGSAYYYNDEFWANVQSVMDVVKSSSKVADAGYFVAGNHEWMNGSVGTSTNATAKKILINTPAKSTAAYQIYGLGASSQNQSYTADDIAKLKSYLESAPSNKPIFVLAHFPLHDYNSRTTGNKDQIISMLNEQAKTKQIIFLWGHNHTESDTTYDKVITDKIGNTPINFTYAAAGCMSDSDYGSGSHSVKGKGLVAKIKGTDVTLTYYNLKATTISTGSAVVPAGGTPHTHEYGEWTETTAGTCTTKAIFTRTCKVCGEKDTKDGELDPSNHGSNPTEIVGKKAATVTEEGYTGDKKCKGCNQIIEEGSVIPKLEKPDPETCTHKFEDYKETTPGTCTKPAILTGTCSICGAEGTKNGDYDYTNHYDREKEAAYETEIRGAFEATEYSEGYTGDICCSGCGEVFTEGEVIPFSHAHSYDDGVVTKEATCVEPGEMTLTCKCGDTKVVVTEVNPQKHTGETEIRNFVAATEEKEGYSGDIYCKSCGEKLEDGKVTQKLGDVHEHDFTTKGEVTKNATCAEDGEAIFTCACGEKEIVKIQKDPNNHVGGSEIRGAIAPTTQNEGYTGDVYCKGCGVKLESGKVLPALTEKLATPEVTSVSNVVGGITVKWGAVEGAKRYRVYRRLVGEGWSKIGEVNAVDGETFTDKTPESGKSYYYTVRCITPDGKKAVSDHTGGLKIICLKSITPSSLTNTSTGITVKWSKVAGAKGYRVYRKTGSESWKLIKEISDGSTVSYTDTAVKSNNGTIYSYAVRATNGKTYGYYTAKKTARVTAVALSSVKCSAKKSLKVTWKQNAKASGYQIQYSTSKTFASGNKSVDVSGAKTLTKTIGSLTKGKTYYVRVRAYKKSGDTKYYSAWSAKKYAKVTK